ncbi:NAD(P)-dependent dehydrogenase (short-subunit alcohol dehydrogenase family) [Thermosporothrix hazakensis]|jgi:NAD(P)-dependent dehydrogenase (short-subunit alcohol dehydrogenase family)|uniref:NAD(P)-dependent dehydrogenase (Short-subunit alcohol dehydrogenase family) n=2 Tax=Thermosporothrix TaxID=768650 RepID=A0A326U636_THEHA|nr:SDR family NAD(P)-dependent oxidoreductase [Thermosporothrix hazakensis]PZW29436.1 NAD(P)-dependent dehydrogenase (short-subunit alcohol dehydrogenase family) [Thermosporothrix hazakensis]BBH85722.1 3-hydroxyacyl-CoA dehydrogenase [Thermosporothrix sp. COM3]GCE45849.1 3-hydroxyacyl-CoA dehydrogenase [Thermosporothrix hazakensis]
MANEVYAPLQGKRAVVTGAGRGIGRSIALTLARAGADVGVTARTAADLDTLVHEIEAMGRRSLAVTCDVTNPEQVRHMAETLASGLGGCDILVNNAGNAGSHKFLDHPDELWHRMLAINLTSVYYVCKAFVPRFIAQKSGRIITIASIASRIGDRYIAAYTASKHGVLGLTRALAAELLPYNITVNAICPGYVDTPMTDGNVQNMMRLTGKTEQEIRATLAKMSPQQRLIEPDEVAGLALYLAQDISKGITGQAINLDGGAVMS